MNKDKEQMMVELGSIGEDLVADEIWDDF